MKPFFFLFIISLLAISLVACGGNSADTTPAATPTPDLNTPEGRGEVLFSGKGRCGTCHSLSPDTVIVGPSLAGIALTAETRVPELNAAQYLEESILRPNAYKAPGFEDVQMDVTLAKTLTIDEIADLVAFLQTQK